MRTTRFIAIAAAVLALSVGSFLPAHADWEELRQCESSGDYANHDGIYRGAYQFDQQTWEGVGGSGDPADASPAEQDARAQQLYDERGAAPWPVCGRHLDGGPVTPGASTASEETTEAPPAAAHPGTPKTTG